MKVPIRHNRKYREAEISFVTKPEFDFLSGWQTCVVQDTNPIRRDAVDFATLACKRFTTHAPFENYAQQFPDVLAHVTDNPRSEVASLVEMRCDWFPESTVIGLAHFRRSWCNNLILDYLAAHPWIAAAPVEFREDVSGVGIGLLYFLSRVASELGCGAIWGEATQNSCEKYKEYFRLESVRDLLYIEKEEFIEFTKTVEQKWAERQIKWTFEI